MTENLPTDEEIMMHAVRLARSGRHHTVVSLRAEMMESYPDAPKEQIDRCLGRVAGALK